MTPITDKIKQPVRYDARRGNLFDRDGKHLAIVSGWSDHSADEVGEYIATCINEHASLKERLHKTDGMANEVNILVRENRRLVSELDRKTRALEIIAGQRQCIDNLMSDKDIAQTALRGDTNE